MFWETNGTYFFLVCHFYFNFLYESFFFLLCKRSYIYVVKLIKFIYGFWFKSCLQRSSPLQGNKRDTFFLNLNKWKTTQETTHVLCWKGRKYRSIPRKKSHLKHTFCCLLCIREAYRLQHVCKWNLGSGLLKLAMWLLWVSFPNTILSKIKLVA